MYDEGKKEIFLSYRRVDKDKFDVEEFKNKLQNKSKLNVFFDKNHMENRDFTDTLRKAVNLCDCFIPVVSENYINFKSSSDWCKQELKIAIEKKKLIVPVFICDANEINEKYNIDTTTEKRKDTDIIDEWDDVDLIKYLTVNNGATDISKDGINLIENCVKNIFNSFCSSDEITFFHDLLEKQNNALKQVSIQSTSYSFDMNDYIDLGITGKPTKAEKEEAEKKQEQDKQRPLSDFLPNLNNFSVDRFIETFEKERYAIVTGDAGQGKSIFLKHICRELGKQADKNGLSRDKLFPIYAEIKKIALPTHDYGDYSFLGALAKASVIGITKEHIDSVCEKGKLCLILDAMDEVSPTTFDELYDKIVKADLVDKCFILLSSRPGQKRIKDSNALGISAELFGKPFRLWTIDNISDEKLSTFVDREAKNNRNNINHDLFCEKFLEALTSNEKRDLKYKDMSRNPFMLKSLVITCKEEMTLPKSKIEAFDIAVTDLIKREVKDNFFQKHKNEFDFADIDNFPDIVKRVLGYLAYASYCYNDDINKDCEFSYQTNENNDNKLCIPQKTFKNITKSLGKKERNILSAFLGENTLVDKSGFVHDLFACYYCAFYLYMEITNNAFSIDKFIVRKNLEADYWKKVVETLICLFELNADNDETRTILETMLESMQTVVKTPDYDILCGAVSQFIDNEYNKPMGESVLIKGMLERGERGIISFDTKKNKYSDGANPYEELFYYVVVNNFVLGLDKIYDENKRKNKLSKIQTHLYNELCKVLSKDNNCLFEKSVDDFTEQFALTSSKNRCNKKNLRGHVKIDNKMKSIGNFEFFYCSELSSVSLGKSVQYIGSWAFFGCSGLTCLEVSKGNTEYQSKGNCIIETKTKTLVLGCKNSVIPDYVRKIGNYAFSHCSGLTSISIPDSVQCIGASSFGRCSGLTNIEVSKGNTKYHSKGNCIIESETNTLVLGCKNSVIPDYVTKIGDYAFYDCTGLTSILIPESVTSIGNYAFSHCSGLTNITIPDSVTCIEESTFNGCSELTSIEVSKGNAKYHSEGNCIIENETNTIVLGCKNSVIPDYVRKIGNYAFKGCSGLTSITIPNSVQSIGDSSFNGCSGLTSITIPYCVTSIGFLAFFFCKNLKDIFYSGTKEQWKSIKGIEKCGIYFKKCTVHCIDGDM